MAGDSGISWKRFFDTRGIPGEVYNYVWSLGMTIGPVVALVLLWEDPGSTSFVLTAIGLGIVIVGVLVVSNVWKTPTYNVILAWDREALPADWEAGRRRYFTINWIQLAVTWAAFALSSWPWSTSNAPAPRHGSRIPR